MINIVTASRIKWEYCNDGGGCEGKSSCVAGHFVMTSADDQLTLEQQSHWDENSTICHENWYITCNNIIEHQPCLQYSKSDH